MTSIQSIQSIQVLLAHLRVDFQAFFILYQHSGNHKINPLVALTCILAFQNIFLFNLFASTHLPHLHSRWQAQGQPIFHICISLSKRKFSLFFCSPSVSSFMNVTCGSPSNMQPISNFRSLCAERNINSL